MDKWFLKYGQICFKDENAELNNWDLKSVVSCLNTRENKLADLEAKLAESEKSNEEHLQYINALELDLKSFKNRGLCAGKVEQILHENDQLKQQLEEKEKEIKWLKEEKQMSDNCVNILTKKLKEKDDDFAYINKISKELGLQNFDYEKQVAILKSSEKCLTENLKKTNQDKLDFAIAELEKAKIEFETYYADNIWNYSEYLQDRIKELTHQHEDKGEE